MGPRDGEGDGTGTVIVAFSVRLSQPAPTTVSVDFIVDSGSALEGVDFAVLTQGPIVFEAGEMATTIEVAIFGDGIDEALEDFSITLTDAVNAIIISGTDDGNFNI